MNKLEFDNAYVNGNKVVHCDTLEKAIAFTRLAHGFGYKWFDSSSYIDDIHYDFHRKETSYNLATGKVSSYKGYRMAGMKVVKF